MTDFMDISDRFRRKKSQPAMHEPSIGNTKNCPHCGRDLSSIHRDIRFCPYCGSPRGAAEEKRSAPVVQAETVTIPSKKRKGKGLIAAGVVILIFTLLLGITPLLLIGGLVALMIIIIGARRYRGAKPKPSQPKKRNWRRTTGKILASVGIVILIIYLMFQLGIIGFIMYTMSTPSYGLRDRPRVAPGTSLESMLPTSIDSSKLTSTKHISPEVDDMHWMFAHPIGYEKGITAEYSDGYERTTVIILELIRIFRVKKDVRCSVAYAID